MAGTEEFVIVTGGPGSGKTTLLDALRALGYAVMAEAGRAIIQAQQAIGGNALHTGDSGLFAELMLSWDLRSHREAAAFAGPVFFDHGVPGLPGYYELTGRPVPAHVTRATQVFRYHPRVFVAPPWAEIYTGDAERTQDFTEAVRTYDAAVRAYLRSGYQLIELPRAPVATRVAAVLDHLAAWGLPQPPAGR